MPTLDANPTLNALQEYVRILESERGFTGNTVQKTALLLGEEIGELFKAIRKHEHMAIDNNSVIGTVDEELADILIYLCAIANRLEIDLEQAFRDKEKLNAERVWSIGT